MFTTVFVAGYGNSINGHWQEKWHQERLGSYWVEQGDWAFPNRDDWVESLNAQIQSINGPIVLITHSLGGSTLVEWSKHHKANIIGAFIVAVPDVQSSYFPDEITGYQNLPLEKLPFPSLVLSSSNDPYSSLERARFFAQHWGSQFMNAGNLGHINTASNLGDWPEGKKIFNEFIESLEA